MTAEMTNTEAAMIAEMTAVDGKNEGAPAMSDNKSAELRYIAVTMTPELLSAIDKECAETGASRGGLLKSIVCSHFGIETTSAPRRAKYATKEEAAEAKKMQTATRNAKIRALLKLHAAGGDVSKLTDDERAAIA
jgi:hypothetical protein